MERINGHHRAKPGGSGSDVPSGRQASHFEEVAGISLFRMRKNEGLRKLEKTAENMERVRDLVALLDEQLGPMKEAAENLKFIRLSPKTDVQWKRQCHFSG